MPRLLVMNGAQIADLDEVTDGYAGVNYHFGLRSTEYPVETGKLLVDNAYRRRERLEVRAIAGSWFDIGDGGHESALQNARTCMERIRRIHRERTLVTVVALKGTFRNMLLTEMRNVEDDRNGYVSAIFDLVFEEVLTADTQDLTLDADQLDGPAEGLVPPVERGLSPTRHLSEPDRSALITTPIARRASGAATPDGGRWDAVRSAVVDAARAVGASTIAGVTIQRISMANTPRQKFQAALALQTVEVEAWFQPRPAQPTWFMTVRNLITGEQMAGGLPLGDQSRPLRGLLLNPIGGELVVAGDGKPGPAPWGPQGHELVYVGRPEE